MDEKEIQSILLEVLRLTVNEQTADDTLKQKMASGVVADVYRLAKKHDLAHVVSHFVYQNQIQLDKELAQKLQREEMISVYRHEQMKAAFEEICGAFEQANIAYLPLKGAIIRAYYPFESMRTSCDIDILIHEDDLKIALQSLEAKGYQTGERSYHDVSVYSPGKIHLELHFNIQESMDNLDEVLKDAWQYAVPTKGSRYDFAKEFFVFHTYAHMAYHFITGGCGIRALLDIWVMEQKMHAHYSCAETLLKKAGIYTFSAQMSEIANACFSQTEQDEFADLVLKYIYSGGVYGNIENSITVEKSKNGGVFSYAIKRLFLPYSTMILAFPILKKAPILLPFCWVLRWIKAIFGKKSKRISAELNYANNVSKEKINETRAILDRLEL